MYRSSVAFTNIRIVQGLAGFYSLFGRAFTLGNTIYMQNTDPATNPNVLVHECCHVWQFQHFGTRYAMDSLWAQATMPTPYDWRIELANGHQRWQDFNREAQAQFLEDAWVEGDQIGGLAGNGVFYQDQPIGSDVEFIDDTTSHTSLAIEAITYVRSLVTFRLSGLF